jgi:hypothetical protein
VLAKTEPFQICGVSIVIGRWSRPAITTINAPHGRDQERRQRQGREADPAVAPPPRLELLADAAHRRRRVGPGRQVADRDRVGGVGAAQPEHPDHQAGVGRDHRPAREPVGDRLAVERQEPAGVLLDDRGGVVGELGRLADRRGAGGRASAAIDLGEADRDHRVADRGAPAERERLLGQPLGGDHREVDAALGAVPTAPWPGDRWPRGRRRDRRPRGRRSRRGRPAPARRTTKPEPCALPLALDRRTTWRVQSVI